MPSLLASNGGSSTTLPGSSCRHRFCREPRSSRRLRPTSLQIGKSEFMIAAMRAACMRRGCSLGLDSVYADVIAVQQGRDSWPSVYVSKDLNAWHPSWLKKAPCHWTRLTALLIDLGQAAEAPSWRRAKRISFFCLAFHHNHWSASRLPLPFPFDASICNWSSAGHVLPYVQALALALALFPISISRDHFALSEWWLRILLLPQSLFSRRRILCHSPDFGNELEISAAWTWVRINDTFIIENCLRDVLALVVTLFVASWACGHGIELVSLLQYVPFQRKSTQKWKPFVVLRVKSPAAICICKT